MADAEKPGAQPEVAEKSLIEQARERREQAGNEFKDRFDGAGQKLAHGWDKTKAFLGKGVSFLSKLGEKTADIMFIDLGEAGKRGGRAVGEAGKKVGENISNAWKADKEHTVDDYKNVSEAVKNKAREVGGKCAEVWKRMVEKKDSICQWGSERMDAVCKYGTKVRETFTGKINDVVLQTKVRAELGKLNSDMGKNFNALDKNEKDNASDARLIAELQKRIAARSEVSANIEKKIMEQNDRLKELQGQTGQEQQTSGSAA
jgi:hypothetical protein